MASVVLGPFYVPRPPYFLPWVGGRPVSDVLISILSANTPIIPRLWRYDYDVNQFWSPVPRRKSFETVVFPQPFLNSSRREYLSTPSWVGQPYPALTAYISIPSIPTAKLWEYDFEYPPDWLGEPRNSWILQNQVANNPFEPLVWNFSYSSDSPWVWSGSQTILEIPPPPPPLLFSAKMIWV